MLLTLPTIFIGTGVMLLSAIFRTGVMIFLLLFFRTGAMLLLLFFGTGAMLLLERSYMDLRRNCPRAKCEYAFVSDVPVGSCRTSW
jgi:hypothetical protein